MALAPEAEGGDRRAAEERLEQIRQYHLDTYAARDVVAQTSTTEGEQVDWVPMEDQVDGNIAEPPPPGDELKDDPDRMALAAPHAFAGPDAEMGPPGTVPMLRKSVDELHPVGDIYDYLAKGPHRKQLTPPDNPIPPATGAAHKYAHAYEVVTCYGTEGFINTWKPYVEWSNEFSLGQLWLVRGSGLQTQTLEVGAQTYPELYNDWSPHLFLYYTTNNYTDPGDFKGGYNTDVKGWVQVATTSFPGMRVAESIAGGDQYDLKIGVQLFDGNWWVRIGGEWMGYYPASLYNDTGLASFAERVDWGGEIVDDGDAHPEATHTAMGSGVMPSGGWTNAAYMRNLSYASDAAGTLTPIQGVPQVTNPASYDLSADWTGTGGWGSYFYFGGPGGI